MKTEGGQNGGPGPALEHCVNSDPVPGATAASPVSFTPGNTQRNDSHRDFLVCSASTPAKRHLEPTHDWSQSKRQKHSQDGGGKYEASPSSTFQSPEATKRLQVETPSFSNQGFYSRPETVLSTTQAVSKHNAFYHPTAPSTDPVLLSYSQSGHTFGFDAGEYQAGDGTLSTVPFPDCLPPVQSYPEYGDVTNHHTSPVGLPLQHVQGQRTGNPQSDQPLIDHPDLNHISAMHRFLYFNASQRAARQSVAVQSKSQGNAVDSIGNEVDNYHNCFLEEGMAQHVEPRPEISHQFPPSSVVRDMDAGSDTEIFDPKLQRSPQNENKGPDHQVEANDSETFEDEELLSSDVDWDDILKSVPSLFGLVSQPQPISHTTPGAQNNTLIGNLRTGSSGKDVAISKIRSTPSRKPIQSPAAYSSPGTPPKMTHKMRTFFRLAELVNEGRRRVNEKPPPTFEFYGWVIQSWRERGIDVQHFHFLDLYKKDDICLGGTLSGWVTNGDLDKQSSAFLGADGKTKETLCRCVCKVQQHRNAGVGLYLVVRFIRPATWAEIGSKRNLTA